MKSKYQSFSAGRVGSSESRDPYRDRQISKITIVTGGLDTPRRFDFARLALAPLSASGLLDQRTIL
jgi:hypothetical protein